MSSRIKSKKNLAHAAVALALLTLGGNATAGITYRLEQSQAVAGDTITVKAVLFNDTDSAMTWLTPKNLVLQWRDENGNAVRSLAYLEGESDPVNVPVNNFVKFSWRAVVPSSVKGLQAINIEGDPTMLALDATRPDHSLLARNASTAPIVDAGAGAATGRDPALPDKLVAAAVATPAEASPAVSTASTAPASSFDVFRSSLSAYEPIYFDVGNEGGRNARYQVSFKYRLFTPDDPNNPTFIDNLYLGYTQTALWDLHSESHPFVDTSFKPSLFWRKDSIWQSTQNDWFVGLASGVEHESNGKSGDESRSLNFAYVQPEFNYRFDGGSTLTFAPRVKAYFATRNNRDYKDYAGYVDWKLRWAQDNGLVLTGLYRQGRESRNMTQIEAAWPLRRTFLNMNGYLHVQYFKGYGETLLGYNRKSDSQVRIGIALVP